MFESRLEMCLWALRGDQVAGTRPWTDKTPIGQWLDELAAERQHVPADCLHVLRYAMNAGKDLADYRHAIVHGWMFATGDMPTFIRNPGLFGEKRHRPTHDAHVSENLLDMAVDSAWTLCQVVSLAKAGCDDPTTWPELAAIGSKVRRAMSQAGELRHLTELMNHEKY
ncbi:hypothetical protein CK220_13940 [Mesorhizobium sp. WSM3860]|nr:hypothetical protein CK220_13940 [Mesorhizobium sp. WSM3860]